MAKRPSTNPSAASAWRSERPAKRSGIGAISRTATIWRWSSGGHSTVGAAVAGSSGSTSRGSRRRCSCSARGAGRCRSACLGLGHVLEGFLDDAASGAAAAAARAALARAATSSVGESPPACSAQPCARRAADPASTTGSSCGGAGSRARMVGSVSAGSVRTFRLASPPSSRGCGCARLARCRWPGAGGAAPTTPARRTAPGRCPAESSAVQQCHGICASDRRQPHRFVDVHGHQA